MLSKSKHPTPSKPAPPIATVFPAWSETINPKGHEKPYDPFQPYLKQKVMRGGSFLCNDSYCSGYRVASRMKSSPDTGLQHTGFRLVKDWFFL